MLFILEKGWGARGVEVVLRHCATSRKVTGSIPDGVTENFIDIILPASTIALGLAQPLTETCTRSISWGGGKLSVRGGCQPYHLYVPIIMKFGIINVLSSSGTVQACNGIALHF